MPIHGTDIDPEKLAKFKQEFPQATTYESNESGILLPQGMPTIVASNTPDHQRAIVERISS